MSIGCIYNVIYKSRCLYVGSTRNFNTRLKLHKSRCYNPNQKEYNKNLYKFIRNHDVWEEFRFNIIDTIETDNSDEDGGLNELVTAEQYYKDMLEPTLNDRDPVMDKVVRRKMQAESSRNLQQKNIDSKRFYCASCGIAASSQWKLDIHYNTKKHKKRFNINN